MAKAGCLCNEDISTYKVSFLRTLYPDTYIYQEAVVACFKVP
jgi:hypothetical protein